MPCSGPLSAGSSIAPSPAPTKAYTFPFHFPPSYGGQDEGGPIPQSHITEFMFRREPPSTWQRTAGPEASREYGNSQGPVPSQKSLRPVCTQASPRARAKVGPEAHPYCFIGRTGQETWIQILTLLHPLYTVGSSHTQPYRCPSTLHTYIHSSLKAP